MTRSNNLRAAERYMQARYHLPGQPRPLTGDRAAAREKAAQSLRDGLRVTWAGATALVPSQSQPGVRYRVTGSRCDCEAAGFDTYCYHLAAVEILRERGEAPAPARPTSRYSLPTITKRSPR